MTTDEIQNLICQRLIEGESLRSICRDEEMPDKSTIFRWILESVEFRDQYALAREMQAEAMADEILEIADDGTNDWMEKHDKDDKCIGWLVNGEAINRSRLRVDTRKWIASRLLPKKYGDKVQTQHTGPDDGPVKFKSEIVFVPAKLDEED